MEHGPKDRPAAERVSNPHDGRMSAYVILDIEVTDPVVYEEYKKKSTGAAAFGGRFVVSDLYRPARALREASARTSMIVVEGAS
jgi:uncharacterized protein (DUF1330 family)